MSNNANPRAALLERQPWLTFLLPFLVYIVAGALEPSPGDSVAHFARWYPVMYAVKITLTLAAVAFVWPAYRQFPLRVSLLAILVGVIGGVLWIVLCLPRLEQTYVLPLLKHVGLGGLIGDRPGFNPFDPSYNLPTVWASVFLAIRFFGLAAVVPLIEEFFLRGFVMRFVMERDWWKVPFGTASRLAIVVGTVVPMLYHPELLAAAVWFSLITWLMLRTRNIWDCVVAHAITNLILGIYVVMMGGQAWQLL
ncbi:MAG: CAAX prenyl protease-related protein [Thermoguttaceae bacterium]